MPYTYLLLNLLTIFVPVLRSFEPRIAYYRKWKALVPSISVVAIIFLVWDYFFTKWGIWSFNHDYVIGQFWAGMPMEEWFFFFTIPFACVFIYEVIRYFLKLEKWEPWAHRFAALLSIAFLVIGILNLDKLYTSVTFLGTGLFLTIWLLLAKPRYLAYFFAMYFIALIPFFMVNGVLTALPVVSYNDMENLGLRIGSIPVEDSVYMMLLLGMNVGLYEWGKGYHNLPLVKPQNEKYPNIKSG